jgi:hypothetical protein
MIASVAVMARATPGHAVVQVLETFVPAASKDAVEPAGGSNSKKLAPKIAPELPESVTTTDVVPAVPVRLYAMSILRSGVELKMWQLLAGHSVHVPPPPETDWIVTLLDVWIATTQTVPATVGDMLRAAPKSQLALLATHPVIRLSCTYVHVCA